jgi:short-subunit dehydrogenase
MPRKKLSPVVNLYSYITYMSSKKNILIIGASSEIAQAIIKNLADKSCILTTTSRSGDNADHSLDLTNSESIAQFLTVTVESTYDWVLYCAGFIEQQESTESFSSTYAIQSQRVNFSSAAQILETLSPSIRKGGGIIALSSTAGIWGSPLFPIYSVWKGALNIFLQTLHKGFKDEERFVFSICIGPTNTRMRERIAGDSNKHQSSDVVAHHILSIIKNPIQFSDFPILVIRDKELSRLDQELIPIH